MDFLIDASQAYASLIRQIQPYIASTLRYIAPSVPYLTYTMGVLSEVLTPLFHTLRLILLTLSSYLIRAMTTTLLSLPPALHPVLILAVLLLGIYVALAAVALVRRATAFLFRLVFNLLFFASLVGLGAYVYQRGLALTMQDLSVAAQTLKGWWVEGERRGATRRMNWQASGYQQEKQWVDAARRARGGGGWW